MFIRFLIFFLIIVVVEFYFLQGVKTFVRDFSIKTKNTIMFITYFFLAVSLLIGFVSLFYPPPNWNNFFRFVSAAALIILVCKLIGISFLLIDDVVRFFRWIYKLLFHKPTEVVDASQSISRLKFFSQLAVTFTVIPAIAFVYGMVRGAYKYRVHKVK
ncbi:MAG: hypothetical protein JNM96_06700, partial [Bacteroidia bacterium]|nr:hypothetical protein [Bacteroidia bacterium]